MSGIMSRTKVNNCKHRQNGKKCDQLHKYFKTLNLLFNVIIKGSSQFFINNERAVKLRKVYKDEI